MKTLPPFRKRSCHNLSGEDSHSNQPQTVSQFSESLLQSRPTNWRIPPPSYSSSLPSLPVYTKTSGGRGDRGRGMRKRPTEVKCFPTAKRGRGRDIVSRSNDDFDEILSSYRQKQHQAISGSEWKEDHVVHEILDSPPHGPPSSSASPPHITANTCHPRTASSSPSADLNAVERTYLMQERESSLTTLPSSPHTESRRPKSSLSLKQAPSRTYHTRSYDKELKGLPMQDNTGIGGVGPALERGVVSECIDVDDEDDCQITDTTASPFTRHSDTSEREASPIFPDPFTPTAEEEVMKFKKATANFRNSTRHIPNHLASRSPSHPPHTPSPSSPTHSNRQHNDILRIVDSTVDVIPATDKSPQVTSASTEQTSRSHNESLPAEHPPHPLTTHTPHTPLLKAVSKFSSSHGNQPPKLSRGPDFGFVIEFPSPAVCPSHPPPRTESPSTPLTAHNSDDDSDFEPVTRNYGSGRRRKRGTGEMGRGEERGRGEMGRGEERGRGRGHTNNRSIFDFTEQSPPPKSNSGSFYRG